MREGIPETQVHSLPKKASWSKFMQQGQSNTSPTLTKFYTVENHLSHHYVLKRSVVFIVDPYYSSVAKREQASKYINDFFD